jgi:hypothetical protein
VSAGFRQIRLLGSGAARTGAPCKARRGPAFPSPRRTGSAERPTRTFAVKPISRVTIRADIGRRECVTVAAPILTTFVATGTLGSESEGRMARGGIAMGWLTVVLDVVFALGGIAAFGFLAFGAWLSFKHSPWFLNEGQGRFAQQHRRRARQAPRVSADKRRHV